MGRILGLDVGDRRIGIALSDETRLIASPLSVYTRVGYGPDVRYLSGLYQEKQCDLVVCGLPKNMDGSEGFQVQKVRDLAALLEKAGLPVEFQDERLSTVTAEDALIAGGMRREERKGTVDKVAAAVILQQYLDAAKEMNTYTEETKMAEDLDKNLPEEELPDDGIVELTDENGETVRFQYLATIEHEEGLFVVLMEAPEGDSAADEEDGEVVILKIEQDENGEDMYVSVDDEDLMQAVFDQFIASMGEDDEDEE